MVLGKSKKLKRIEDYNLQAMQLRLQKEADEKKEDDRQQRMLLTQQSEFGA
jgi:hypothetical protein